MINEGITIIVVIIKSRPISIKPVNGLPEDEAKVVLPAVPIEASKAYCVAV